MKKTPKNVDSFIAGAPTQVRGKLREIRKAIRSAAPDALEKISYGMPFYSYKGRLAYFNHWKAHLGLYVPTPIVQRHKKYLRKYDASGATIRFPLHKKIPLGLIKKLIKSAVRKNLDRMRGK